MPKNPKVLAITKRMAQLCATQSLLYSAGMQLVTATSMAMAKNVINSLHISAVIVCKDSWSVAERDEIAEELGRLQPQLTFLMRCPGCTGCDEAAGHPGTLKDALPLIQLMAAVTPTNG